MMQSRNFYLAFGAMMAVGLFTFYLIRFGYYPIVFVDSAPISADSFYEEADSALNFYHKTTPAADDKNGEDLAAVIKETRRATLDKMIGDRLVYKELERRFGGEAGALVQAKIDNALKNLPENFERAVLALYSLSVDRFRDVILLPQARQEVLEGRIVLENDKFSDWISGARRNAAVIILAPDLKWADGQVEFR